VGKTPFAGSFIVVFLICAGFFGFSNLADARSKADPVSWKNILNGKWALSYEAAFNKSVDIYQPSIDTWGLFNYLLFQEGRDGVLIGEDGWLFTKEEFDYFPHQDQEVEEKIEYIKEVHDRLAARNVKMVVALIPAKARVYEENLGRYNFPSYKDGLYKESERELQSRGIAVADIYDAMKIRAGREGLFLKTDTHWTPQGAAVAADAVAKEIKAEFPDLSLESSSFKTIPGAPVIHSGDLLRYLPLGPLGDEIGPAPDRLLQVKTVKIENDPGGENALENTLFGTEKLPVTLVGTSYSANPQWNFEGFLKEALHTEILNAADEGRGPFETMKDYLEDDSFKSNPPELVVWEIPERYLPVSYDLAKQKI